MARPRVPTAVKLAGGSLNKTRERQRQQRRIVPENQRGIPVMPDYLSDEERKAWQMFGEVIEPLGICSVHDFAAYEALVTSYVVVQRLRAAQRATTEPRELIEATRAVRSAEGSFVNWLKAWAIAPGELAVAKVAFSETHRDAAKSGGLNEFAQ